MYEFLREVINLLAKLYTRGVKLRTVLFLISIIVGTTVYHFVANFINLDISHLELPFITKKYTFYSGAPGGFYTYVGAALEQEAKKEYTLEIKNVPTAGSLENAIKVMTSHRAFGLTQMESLQRDEFMKGEIRIITPLYMARLHVIYNKQAFAKYVLPE